MLSRIANSLFWMGRYIERADQSARYIKVHYYSALDAPMVSKQDFIFESILTMLGLDELYKKSSKIYQEDKINNLIALDDSNPVSIRQSFMLARENARGARDSISSDLWSSINKFYHELNSYNEKRLKKEGIYSFTDKVMENCSIIEGYIDNTLIHNEAWALIRMGIHLERATQTARVINSKVKDIQKIGDVKLEKSIESYHCVTMLKSMEAFDMSRMNYKAVPNMTNALEFLILKKEFPKSIAYNVNQILEGLTMISKVKEVEFGSVEFEVGKLNSEYKFMTISDINEDINEFIESTLTQLYEIGVAIEEKYLSY